MKWQLYSLTDAIRPMLTLGIAGDTQRLRLEKAPEACASSCDVLKL
jgi:hypothetical protein